jgi:hypothetical protein
MSADIEPPTGWRKVMGPIKGRWTSTNPDIAILESGEWDVSGWVGDAERQYAIRIGSDIDKENPPDYPAEWQSDKGWVKVEKPQPTTVRGWLETLPDGYRERALGQSDASDKLAGSLECAIMRFAQWNKTNEGYKFWQDVRAWSFFGQNGDLPPLPADPPESPVVTTLETTLDDDLAERIAIAIAPAIIAEWSYNNEDLPAEIAKLAKAIAGELRK